MPRPIVLLVPHIVRPRGSVNHEIRSGIAAITLQLRINRILAEQLFHQLPCLWSEMFLCDQCNRLMTFAAPRACRRHNAKGDCKCASKSEDSQFHLPALFENSRSGTISYASVAEPFPDGLPGFGMIANHAQRGGNGNGQNEALPRQRRRGARGGSTAPVDERPAPQPRNARAFPRRARARLAGARGRVRAPLRSPRLSSRRRDGTRPQARRAAPRGERPARPARTALAAGPRASAARADTR